MNLPLIKKNEVKSAGMGIDGPDRPHFRPDMISIITPVYNGIRFIDFCIQNVLKQRSSRCEHIIVDGGSTDGTAEIIKKYALQYTHIRWISEKDSGQSDAMNKGIRMAKGHIVGILNVDDYYESNALNHALQIFESLPEPSLLVGNCNVWNKDGRLWFVSKPSKISFHNLLAGKFIEALPMNASAYFYHKSLHERTGLYNVEEHYAMDVEFLLKAAESSHIRYVDELFGNYRYLEGTKTFCNDRDGKTQEVVKKIVYDVLRRQPFFQRVSLKCQYELPRTRLGKMFFRKSWSRQ